MTLATTKLGHWAVAVATAVAVVIITAAPASASAKSDDAANTFLKRQRMSQYTQPSLSSFNLWTQNRVQRGEWSRATFDWSTDFCSSSPDQPFGFDFRMPCYRHDWGYRNYNDEGLFDQNKARLDNALYSDLLRVCDDVNELARPACDSLAWTYYHAVDVFGVLAVSDAELAAAAALLENEDMTSAQQESE